MSPARWPPGTTTSGLTKPSKVGPADENEVTPQPTDEFGFQLSVIAPTVITYGVLPGTETLIGLGPKLPAEATTTMPACHSFMTAWSIGSFQ